MRRGVSIRRVLLAVVGVLAVVVVVLNWTYGRLPAEPRPTGSFVRVDGLRIHYIEHPGPGSPVVLIHGLPGTAEDWNEVTPLLAGHRTIAIDRPGFGYSTGGYVPFDRQLETIDALLGKLHVVRPILVGHSYGGTIALGFAERYPSEVRGLVLVDAAAAGQHVDGFADVQAHFVKFLQLPVVRQIANATFGQLLITVSVNQADAEAFHPFPVVAAHRQRVLEINMTHGNLEAWSGEILASTGVIAQIDKGLSAVETPAVVIQGEQDELVNPSHGRKLAATLPHARLVMVHGGHMQPYDHPAAIAAAVQSIWGSAPSSARQPVSKASRCTAGDIRVSLSGPISAITGEHARYFALTNVSQSPCVIDGSPRIKLYHGARPLPFIYSYGRGMYVGEGGVPAAPGPPVALAPGSTTGFLVAKFRCESGRGVEATELRFSLPGNTTDLQISLPPGGGGYGVSALTYCFNNLGLPPHLGNEIEVSGIFAKRS